MKESLPMALIVDDDIDWVEILDASIATLGYDTTAVPDPPRAMNWLSQNRPSLILLDLLMPNGNGVELARWIRTQKHLDGVPVVIISGLKDDATVSSALKLDSIDYIHKPFKLDTLRVKTDRLLQATSARR